MFPVDVIEDLQPDPPAESALELQKNLLFSPFRPRKEPSRSPYTCLTLSSIDQHRLVLGADLMDAVARRTESTPRIRYPRLSTLGRRVCTARCFDYTGCRSLECCSDAFGTEPWEGISMGSYLEDFEEEYSDLAGRSCWDHTVT